MKISTISIVLFLFFNTLFYAVALCEQSESSKKIGITASLQNTQFDILVPIWVRENFSISPAFGFVWAESRGTDLSIGVLARVVFMKDEVTPYIGLRVGSLIAKPSGMDPITDWLLGVAFGGEYFIVKKFSLGIESQLNLTISDAKSLRFGNPGNLNFNTAAAVFATLYF